jgi:pimeloyl-ACP methyl ester carboxylesterase/predicted glycosyltransferase
MSTLEPDTRGRVERGGVQIAYEVFGSGARTILLLPSWQIVDRRHWKGQVHHLARHFRVIRFDARGGGRSGRPDDAAAYAISEIVDDAIAVLDATATRSAVVAGLSAGGTWALALAAAHPARVAGVVALAPHLPYLTPAATWRPVLSFTDDLGTDEGWARMNAHSWRRDFAGFVEFFFGQVFCEPHSTKQIDDALAWALETTDAEQLLRTIAVPGIATTAEAEALVRASSCRLLLIHGDEDRIVPLARSERVAELAGERARLVVIEGGGHAVQARDPVLVNSLIHEFADAALGRPPGMERHRRGVAHRPRALFVSSPIGLGHARRDIAIARELRRLRPALGIDWLAQPPVTAALAAAGERVHPASARLLSESAHVEHHAAGHELNAFAAIRDMDEILVANYMIFRDVVRAETYDLWIGDEAWDVDHFLHENPGDKRAAYVWLSDFVGWLPLPEGGDREAFLTADANAEMVEQVERFPRIRDRAIFVGDPADVVPDRFGPGLPAIRPWVEQRFAFSGQLIGREQDEPREALRERFGYGPDERVCLVAVGGSGVGAGLLRTLIGAHEAIAARVPGLRTIAVAGPRIDPSTIPAPAGVEVVGYVPDLDRRLAACDVALVQGGLTTGMELVAAGTPFVSFPLRRHFEQRRHVAHRLARHGHETVMEAADATPERVADAVARALARPPRYAPVSDDGARRAAELIAELV